MASEKEMIHSSVSYLVKKAQSIVSAANKEEKKDEMKTKKEIEKEYVGNLLETLSDIITVLLDLSSHIQSSTSLIYERPVRLIINKFGKHLDFAGGVLKSMNNKVDGEKAINNLQESKTDVQWFIELLRYRFNSSNESCDLEFLVPPIASGNCLLAWIWSCIAAILSSPKMDIRVIEAAEQLYSFGYKNDENQQIIIQEGGVGALLGVLRIGPTQAQVHSAAILSYLATDQYNGVRLIIEHGGTDIIAGVLWDRPVRIPAKMAVIDLISCMAQKDPVAQEALGESFAITELLSCLTPEQEPEELELKVKCAKALYFLLKDSVPNGIKITKTITWHHLVYYFHSNNLELRTFCLNAALEICKVGEVNREVGDTFKTSAPGAKSIVEHFTEFITQAQDSDLIVMGATAVGCLARIFKASNNVLTPLVALLGHENYKVCLTACSALRKFVAPRNFLCQSHSRFILQCHSHTLEQLLSFMDPNDDDAMFTGTIFLCHLAQHVGYEITFDRSKAMQVLDNALATSIVQHRSANNLIQMVRFLLELY